MTHSNGRSINYRCGATSTLTDSLINMTYVVPKLITIQLALDGATMQATHVGTKTYSMYDRTGSIRPISTRALYVKELKQDLLGGRALIESNYRVILDKDPDISGIYPVASDRSIDVENSFPFVSEYSDGLFFLLVAAISAQKYRKCRDTLCGIEDYSLPYGAPFCSRQVATCCSRLQPDAAGYSRGRPIAAGLGFGQLDKCRSKLRSNLMRLQNYSTIFCRHPSCQKSMRSKHSNTSPSSWAYFTSLIKVT
jgi:hypothetical protein